MIGLSKPARESWLSRGAELPIGKFFTVTENGHIGTPDFNEQPKLDHS
jgi:hypothetical protein